MRGRRWAPDPEGLVSQGFRQGWGRSRGPTSKGSTQGLIREGPCSLFPAEGLSLPQVYPKQDPTGVCPLQWLSGPISAGVHWGVLMLVGAMGVSACLGGTSRSEDGALVLAGVSE